MGADAKLASLRKKVFSIIFFRLHLVHTSKSVLLDSVNADFTSPLENVFEKLASDFHFCTPHPRASRHAWECDFLRRLFT